MFLNKIVPIMGYSIYLTISYQFTKISNYSGLQASRKLTNVL